MQAINLARSALAVNYRLHSVLAREQIRTPDLSKLSAQGAGFGVEFDQRWQRAMCEGTMEAGRSCQLAIDALERKIT